MNIYNNSQFATINCHIDISQNTYTCIRYITLKYILDAHNIFDYDFLISYIIKDKPLCDLIEKIKQNYNEVSIVINVNKMIKLFHFDTFISYYEYDIWGVCMCNGIQIHWKIENKYNDNFIRIAPSEPKIFYGGIGNIIS